ncbi:hypothetical protein TCAL_14592 [Tigriopus californicus]|uniref:Uncharacterized protein n=1 Tax=Tigriopus californicus TaxID=6832 RepID=A0A553PD62_TIGCA|nr:PAXIP1-associated glutamate-rich protein 1-like [Tigriopus californicus]TRY75623.1 hypothetical protein TCAL_14592 [Tigriopus californicus]
MSTNLDDPDWYVACSDEEVYVETGTAKGSLGTAWRPKSEEVVTMFERIQREGTLPLRWVCPGRRPPTPQPLDDDNEYETDDDAEDEKNAPGSNSATPLAQEKNDDFDFDVDDSSATPKLTPRRPLGQRELKGSARKKTTSFNNVLSNMKRHRQMDAANRAAIQTPTSSTPTTTTASS